MFPTGGDAASQGTRGSVCRHPWLSQLERGSRWHPAGTLLNTQTTGQQGRIRPQCQQRRGRETLPPSCWPRASARTCGLSSALLLVSLFDIQQRLAWNRDQCGLTPSSRGVSQHCASSVTSVHLAQSLLPSPTVAPGPTADLPPTPSPAPAHTPPPWQLRALLPQRVAVSSQRPPTR